MRSHHDVLTVLMQTQRNRAKQPWAKTSETVSQNKPFLLTSCLFQVFCHNNGKLTNPISFVPYPLDDASAGLQMPLSIVRFS
jgi:hypothetical protein